MICTQKNLCITYG